jgi:hypothetical protein
MGKGRPLADAPVRPDDVQCLLCGKWGPFLGTHIKRVHGLTAAEYRQRFDLRAREGIASASYRARKKEAARGLIETGVLCYDHLPRAVEAARHAGRRMSPSARDAQKASVAEARPGDHSRLPPGAKRRDGRDAAWARIAQERRRAIQAEQARRDAADAEYFDLMRLINERDDSTDR